jgi:hypothetical protein
MLRRFTILAGLALAVLAPRAQAFTPESGWYYNIAEQGSGVSLEIQDNYVFMAGYTYTATGAATWFTAQGLMTGNSRFSGELYAFANGQCLGCVYRVPDFVGATGGPINIVWQDEISMDLTWGGVTKRFVRHDYYLTRTANTDAKTEMMLGEWQVVMDLYDRGGDYQLYPFYGDVLVFNLLDRARTPDYFVGCRPFFTDYTNPCTSSAIAEHDAAGFYSPGNNPAHTHVIVVKDVPGSGGSPAVYFAYFVNVGTYQFDGVLEIYNENQNPGDGPYYPVRGFRSASRSFVETGLGPSSADAKTTSSRAPRGLSESWRAQFGNELPRGMSAAEVEAKYGFNPIALHSKVADVVDYLETK